MVRAGGGGGGGEGGVWRDWEVEVEGGREGGVEA